MTFQQSGIRCTHCGDVIYSNSRHDFEECLCGASFIDGGYDYRRWGGDGTGHTPDWVTRTVPVKGGRRDQPWYYRDEPGRAKVLREKADGVQPSPG